MIAEFLEIYACHQIFVDDHLTKAFTILNIALINVSTTMGWQTSKALVIEPDALSQSQDSHGGKKEPVLTSVLNYQGTHIHTSTLELVFGSSLGFLKDTSATKICLIMDSNPSH